MVGGNLVTWRSKKQPVVARSNAKEEYMVVTQGKCELQWLKRLLEELRVNMKTLMKLYCDNKDVINIANNPMQHDQTKHVKVDRHFIKEKLENGLICLSFIPMNE